MPLTLPPHAPNTAVASSHAAVAQDSAPDALVPAVPGDSFLTILQACTSGAEQQVESPNAVGPSASPVLRRDVRSRSHDDADTQDPTGLAASAAQLLSVPAQQSANASSIPSAVFDSNDSGISEGGEPYASSLLVTQSAVPDDAQDAAEEIGLSNAAPPSTTAAGTPRNNANNALDATGFTAGKEPLATDIRQVLTPKNGAAQSFPTAMQVHAAMQQAQHSSPNSTLGTKASSVTTSAAHAFDAPRAASVTHPAQPIPVTAAPASIGSNSKAFREPVPLSTLERGTSDSTTDLQDATSPVADAGSLVVPAAVSTSAQGQDASGNQQPADRKSERAATRGTSAGSDTPVTFGMGGWLVASQQDGTPALGHAAAPHVRSANDGMSQLNFDRVASDSSARRLTEALRSDMAFGIHTDSFGRVDVQASLKGAQLTSQISLEQAHLHASSLAAHMPALEAQLGAKYQLNASVTVRADGGAFSGSTTDRHSQSHGNPQQPNTTDRTAVVAPGSVVGPNTSVSSQASNTFVPTNASERLDVTI